MWLNFSAKGFFFLFISLTCKAQSYQVIAEVLINKASCISVDKNDCIYIGDEKGNINKYDKDGKVLLHFSPQKLGKITLLEAWQTVRIFAFYPDFQEYLISDRFLNPVSPNKIPQDLIGFAQVASLAADNSIWVFDNSDFSIKKYNPQTQQIVLNTPLDLLLNPSAYEINFMREYQNLLLVNDKNSGILIFDNLGNYQKKLSYKNLNYISVYQDELCLLIENKLLFFNLYTLTERFEEIPPIKNPLFAVLLGEKIALLSEDKLYILGK